MSEKSDPARKGSFWGAAGRHLAATLVIVLVTLVALEFLLRVADFRHLRLSRNEASLLYSHDPELGWFPIPNSSVTFTGNPEISAGRTITAKHNSLGLRDVEHDSTPKPTILILGDSYVWGADVEADERLTTFIQQQLPSYRIVNAGIVGYGTDQEYLMLRRIWDKVKPDAVVLVVFGNDHDDNSSNSRYGSYKPYFRVTPEGGAFAGQPVPKTRHFYFRNNWLVDHLQLARLVVSAYVALRYPIVYGPDPTERLLVMMRDFIEARGAKFLIADFDNNRMQDFFTAQKIPFVSLAETDRDDLRYIINGLRVGHWNEAGHAAAAASIVRLLQETGTVKADALIK